MWWLPGVAGLPLAELAAEEPVVAAVTEETPGAARLRLVLSGVYSLHALLDGRHRPAAMTRLRARTSQAWELTHAAGRYAELADLLRGLIPDLETAVRALPEDQRADAAGLMATAYQACSAALAKVSEPEAAWIAAQRAMAAAERTGNPLLIAAAPSAGASAGPASWPELESWMCPMATTIPSAAPARSRRCSPTPGGRISGIPRPVQRPDPAGA